MNSIMEYVWAFLVGGGICLIGQILLDATTLTAPRILVIFVVSGVLLQVAAYNAAAGKGIETAQLAPAQPLTNLPHRPADKIEQAAFVAQVGDNLLLQIPRVFPCWR